MSGIFTHREAYASGGPNIIANPDFEDNAVFWGQFGTTVVTRSTAEAHTGIGSLEVAVDAIGEGAQNARSPVLGGRAYDTRLWVNPSANTIGNITLRLSELDAEFNETGLNDKTIASPLADAWTLLAFDAPITLDPDTRSVVVQFLSQHANPLSYFLDDVFVGLSDLIQPIPVYRGSRIWFPPGPGRLAIKLRAGDSDAEPDRLTDNGDDPSESIRVLHRRAYTGLSDDLDPG